MFHFTTINIASGATVRLGSDKMGTRPVVWLASGDVTIAGTIDLNGQNGHSYDQAHRPAVAGAGGYNGGVGYQQSIMAATPGEGPGGGPLGTFTNGSGYTSHGGGAGHARTGSRMCDYYSGCAQGGVAYGNKYLLPLIGGSGGAGGATANGTTGGGGGAGGGALLVASSTAIALSGSISAKGGNGASQNSSGCSAGGSGSGGAVRLAANSVTGGGRIDVSGGTTNAAGSAGYIRVEGYTITIPSTNMLPGAIMATPGLPLLPPPESMPQVRIVTIDGIAVPVSPKGTYTLPDVTINKNDSLDIAIAAKNIPVGTVVHLTLHSENEGVFTFDAPALAGTYELSSATARTRIPPGYSRVSMKANW